MAGDYTRFTFDPVKGYSGVRKQQGRVSLDAEHNELEEILDRRDRAEMLDTVGRAVVPATTRSGFEIAALGTGLTIGAGRAFVDGILAECFGDPSSIGPDPLLGGPRGTAPIAYDKQPFFYTPGYPARSAAATVTDLVYLDVWQREVTVYEAPELREPALGGPDTATRVQTAWQVKVLQDVKIGTCEAAPAGWDAIVAPSTGRLSVDAPPGSAPKPGPCVIDPRGGYTGLENRLYRVEIHKGGTFGGPKAQFKWSRDNASLGATVLSAAPAGTGKSKLVLDSTGRDDWTRLAKDDSVELIDDGSEFALRDKDEGRPFAKIDSVNPATGEIVVDQDWSTVVDPNRHPRLRHWQNTNGNPLQDATAGATIVLDEGIEIKFSGGGTDRLRAGDHWVFAARTATGEVDRLVAAPPRGITHHFARLALVRGGTSPLVLRNCRRFWPAIPCCTATVEPGQSIQEAIDSLGDKGGCVCLKMGVHDIPATLTITRSNVTLHGEAARVTVRLPGHGPALRLSAAEDVSVLGIRFESRDGSTPDPLIVADQVLRGRIADCALEVSSSEAAANRLAGGVLLRQCRDFTIESTALTGFWTGILGELSTDVRIRQCALKGLFDDRVGSLAELGIRFANLGDFGPGERGIAIEDNDIDDYRRGIEVGDVTVLGNRIEALPRDDDFVEQGCRVQGNVVRRRRGTEDRPDAGALAFAIATHVIRSEVIENAAAITSPEECGVLAAGENTLVARNVVQSTIAASPGNAPPRLPYGVALYHATGEVLGCTVRDNLFTGIQQAVLAVGGQDDSQPVHRVDVVDNHVRTSAAAIIGTVDRTDDRLKDAVSIAERYASIVLADIQDGRIGGNEISGAACGILAGLSDGLDIVGNRLNDSEFGILLYRASHCSVNENVVVGSGTAGIMTLVGSAVSVQRNAVRATEFAIGTILGTATRLAGNEVQGGGIGLELMSETDGEVLDNTVTESSRGGIAAFQALGLLTVRGNRVIRCGYLPGDNAPPAIGILVPDANAAVMVDGCEVLDTGEAPPGKPPFTRIRLGIDVHTVGSVTIRGCRVSSPALPELPGGRTSLDPSSRAILVDAVGGDETITGTVFADVTDTVAEQEGAAIVEVASHHGTVFVGNRCTNLAPRSAPGAASVIVVGRHLAVSSNQIHARKGDPSLHLALGSALSAVGNVTTLGASIAAPGPFDERPTPYDDFNVTVPPS